MRSFVDEGPAERVVFGAGTIRLLPDELDRLGSARALVLTTAQQSDLAARILQLLGDRAVGQFSQAAMHTQVSVTEAAVEVARYQRADGVVSAGGGSTTGLGKAIASRLGIPHLVLPTTYAGSAPPQGWGGPGCTCPGSRRSPTARSSPAPGATC